MKTRLLLTALLVLAASLVSMANDDDGLYDKDKHTSINKKLFRNKQAGFREAWHNLREGNYWYDMGESYFPVALPFYLEANRYNNQVAALHYKIGRCYLQTTEKALAVKYFQKAYQLDSLIAPDIHYYLGRAYQYNMAFELAEAHYREHLAGLSRKERAYQRSHIHSLMDECVYGTRYTASPVPLLINNMGTAINSDQGDYCPLVSADESLMVFTSRRRETTGGGVDIVDMAYYEDIYISKQVDQQWQTAQNIGMPINGTGHDATVGLSPDGQNLFIYKGQENAGDLYISHWLNGQWEVPSPLKGDVNSPFHESSASMTADGQTLYFVSNRPKGSCGGHDIYRAVRNKRGQWVEVTNLGSVVNTSYDEEAVFVHPQGHTLYFSSKGHHSMGGFDIFRSSLQADGSWSKPVNMGHPINTAADELFFVLSGNGYHAYYTSNAKSGLGGQDIYQITFTLPEPQSIYPYYTSGAVQSIDDLSARMTDLMPPLPQMSMQKLQPKSTDSQNYRALNPVYFDFDKSQLTAESKNQLDHIFEVLEERPDLELVIRGHTDSDGADAYNVRLSENRAQEVSNYFINRGVSTNRLHCQAYGEHKPAESNNNANGRSLNRRVDFQLIRR